jgi:hypothetical protein
LKRRAGENRHNPGKGGNAMRFRGAILAGVLVLGGCGPSIDIPGNVPKLGRWERSVKVTALIANDVWIDRKDAPFKLPPDKTEIEQCMEPVLRTAEDLNREMMKGSDATKCSYGEIVRDGRNFSSKGTCAPQEMEGSIVSGTVELAGKEGEDKLSAKVSASMLVKDKTGASERLRFGLEAKWTRLGDCGKG